MEPIKFINQKTNQSESFTEETILKTREYFLIKNKEKLFYEFNRREASDFIEYAKGVSQINFAIEQGHVDKTIDFLKMAYFIQVGEEVKAI